MYFSVSDNVCCCRVISNDDVYFPKGTLPRLAAEMARELADPTNADVGVYKPRMNFWPPNWSCFIVTAVAARTVGLFDENFYPIYHEDHDYELRLRHARLREKVLQDVKVSPLRSPCFDIDVGFSVRASFSVGPAPNWRRFAVSISVLGHIICPTVAARLPVHCCLRLFCSCLPPFFFYVALISFTCVTPLLHASFSFAFYALILVLFASYLTKAPQTSKLAPTLLVRALQTTTAFSAPKLQVAPHILLTLLSSNHVKNIDSCQIGPMLITMNAHNRNTQLSLLLPFPSLFGLLMHV